MKGLLGDECFNAAWDEAVQLYKKQLPVPSSGPADPKLAEPGHRYTAAWGEISQRVAQRQTLVAYYTTIGGTLLSISYLAQNGESAKTVLAYAVAPLSVAFALLLGMHERQIAVLRSFLAKIEMLDEVVAPCKSRYPKFYVPNHDRSRVAHNLRLLHDGVAVGLVGSFATMAVYIIYCLRWDGSLAGMGVYDCFFAQLSLVSWLFSMVYLGRNSWARQDIFDELMGCGEEY